MERTTPWYLKNKTLYFFCIVTPPIGYLVLLMNLKKFEQTQKFEYLSIATIMLAVWMLKFLPEKLNTYVWATIITFLIGSVIIKFLKGSKGTYK